MKHCPKEAIPSSWVTGSRTSQSNFLLSHRTDRSEVGWVNNQAPPVKTTVTGNDHCLPDQLRKATRRKEYPGGTIISPHTALTGRTQFLEGAAGMPSLPEDNEGETDLLGTSFPVFLTEITSPHY